MKNPKLADMTAAALTVLEKNPKGFWLMVEAGDVDWANHDNNIDNSIGAVNSGDAAVKTITDWVERHSNWNETLLVVTADHGHYLVFEKPELLIGNSRGQITRQSSILLPCCLNLTFRHRPPAAVLFSGEPIAAGRCILLFSGSDFDAQ